jgi:transcriptional regulator with XRE-family HTH domain
MLATTANETSFSQRLAQACDDSTIVPEYGKGRQVAIAKRLAVTQEAVRKWFTSEAVPRPDKMRALADYLEVDESWLALGIKPELSRDNRRRHRTALEGAVHLVAGLIMLEGGHCAFPSEKDPHANLVDVYAIMRGTQMAIHISLAREISEGHYEFSLPRNYADVRCIGVVQLELGKHHFLDLTSPLVDKHRQRKAGDFVIAVSKQGSQYVTGSHNWSRFKTFGELV